MRNRFLSIILCTYLSLAASLISRLHVFGSERCLSVCCCAKRDFLNSLESLETLNVASSERTGFLNRLIDSAESVPIDKFMTLDKIDIENDVTLENPGDWSSMKPVAPGLWKVIYAPHMSTMARIAGNGSFDVTYDLRLDGSMTSHAELRFDWLKPSTILSVSGTYGSESAEVCRIDFNRAWVTRGSSQPIQTIEEVPDSVGKTIINRLGQAAFIPQFSIFPVSFLDSELIVFDFELLGTRICARKLS